MHDLGEVSLVEALECIALLPLLCGDLDVVVPTEVQDTSGFLSEPDALLGPVKACGRPLIHGLLITLVGEWVSVLILPPIPSIFWGGKSLLGISCQLLRGSLLILDSVVGEASSAIHLSGCLLTCKSVFVDVGLVLASFGGGSSVI